MAEGGDGGSGSEAIGAAAGVAGLLPAFFGRGQNKRLAGGFYNAAGYDPNASLFGGQKGGLKKYTTSIDGRTRALDNQATMADARQANLANYSRANVWEGAQAQARQGQQQLAQAQMDRALGRTPSIAQMQADRQMQQAAAAQGAQQASARGAAGLALAGQVAAGNTANAQSSISGQAQINAANERMQAEGAAQNAFGNIRGGDANAQAAAAQQAQFQAQQQQASRDANDQRALGSQQLALGNQQLGLNARLGELNARTSNQGALANAHTAAQVANQHSADQNAGSKGLIQTVGDFFSDERAKTPLLLMGGAPRRPDEPMPAMGPGSGAAVPSYEVLNNGAEDVAASGRQMSNFATKYVNNPASGPSMMSDERTKRPMLAKGIRPKDEGPRDPAPKATFDPVHGWTRMSDSEAASYNEWRGSAPDDWRARQDWRQGEAEALREQEAREKDDATNADIDRQVEERRAQDTRERTDPAVGLERIARDRSLIRAPGPVDENAMNDQEKGLAPGTTDFTSTQPKVDPGPGKRPWWSALGEASKSLNAAQFGDGHRGPMLSDERAKRAYYELGRADMRDGRKPAQPLGRNEVFTISEDGTPRISQIDYQPSHTVRRMDPNSFEHSKAMAEEMGAGPDAVRERAPWEPPPSEDVAAFRKGARASDDADFAASQESSLKKPERPSAGASAAGSGAGDVVADANRAMEGSAYAYKPGFTPPDQRPGEPNFGPMAQNMERNPITATAVKEDPQTGMKTIDRDKALKVTMAGLADLQKQNDTILKLLPGRRIRK